MARMTRHKKGFRHLFVEVPEVVWDWIAAQAEARSVSMAAFVTELVREQAGIPESDLPKRQRAGRPRKRAKGKPKKKGAS